MTDKSLALQIFHQIRIETQIYKRLWKKTLSYRDSIDALSNALTNFAKYKDGNILIRDGTLWLVKGCSLEEVDNLDLAPRFCYRMMPIAYRDRLKQPLYNTDYSPIPIGAEQMPHYRLATSVEIASIVARLPVVVMHKANAKKYKVIAT